MQAGEGTNQTGQVGKEDKWEHVLGSGEHRGRNCSFRRFYFKQGVGTEGSEWKASR